LSPFPDWLDRLRLQRIRTIQQQRLHLRLSRLTIPKRSQEQAGGAQPAPGDAAEGEPEPEP
jgi:hypothetical protein